MKISKPRLKVSYTTIEAARLLRLSIRTVQLMVDRGELQAWKTPRGHRRIFIDSVERQMATRYAREPQQSSHGGILVIEDSTERRALVLELLREHCPKVEVHATGDGILGLTMYGRFRPNLLIVGLPIPGIDSFDLTHRLRSHPYFLGSRCLVITDTAEDELRKNAAAVGLVSIVDGCRLEDQLPTVVQEFLAMRRQASDARRVTPAGVTVSA